MIEGCNAGSKSPPVRVRDLLDTSIPCSCCDRVTTILKDYCSHLSVLVAYLAKTWGVFHPLAERSSWQEGARLLSLVVRRCPCFQEFSMRTSCLLSALLPGGRGLHVEALISQAANASGLTVQLSATRHRAPVPSVGASHIASRAPSSGRCAICPVAARR